MFQLLQDSKTPQFAHPPQPQGQQLWAPAQQRPSNSVPSTKHSRDEGLHEQPPDFPPHLLHVDPFWAKHMPIAPPPPPQTWAKSPQQSLNPEHAASQLQVVPKLPHLPTHEFGPPVPPHTEAMSLQQSPLAVQDGSQ